MNSERFGLEGLGEAQTSPEKSGSHEKVLSAEVMDWNDWSQKRYASD